jgi:prepilin-type N-terminal cleavage/methylation domain-containing protein
MRTNESKTQNTSTSKSGFTLIELLIVVAIIAILAAIAVPNFLEAQVRAKVAREQNDLRTMATAIEAYMIDNNTYPRDSDSSLELQYAGAANGIASITQDDAFNPKSPKFGLCANGALTLTTPMAYMNTLLSDPFSDPKNVKNGASAIGYRIASGAWSYGDPTFNTKDGQGAAEVFALTGAVQTYAIIGIGPDQLRARMAYKCFPFMPSKTNPGTEIKTGAAPGAADDPTVSIVTGKAQPGCWTDYDATNGTTSIGDVYRFGGAMGSGRWMRNGQVVGTGVAGAGVDATQTAVW